MSELAEWISDWRWALSAREARRWRRKLPFSQRALFDREIRPRLDAETVIAYPDALYHITADDVIRAMTLTMQLPTPSTPLSRPHDEAQLPASDAPER